MGGFGILKTLIVLANDLAVALSQSSFTDSIVCSDSWESLAWVLLANQRSRSALRFLDEHLKKNARLNIETSVKNHIRGTTQFAVLLLPLSGSNNPYAFTQQSRGVSTQHTRHTRVYHFSGSRLRRDGFSGSFYRLTPAADSLKKQCLDRLRHSLY